MIYSHSGDIGDLIYGLSLLHYTKCDKFIICDYPNGPQRFRISKKSYENMEHLLLSQPYINKVLYCHKPYHTPMLGFRHWLKWFSIPESHFFAYAHGQETALEIARGVNWINGIKKRKGKKVIVHKSPRYWHGNLNISAVLSLFKKDDIGFIGGEDEYYVFINQYNLNIDYVETPTLLDAACTIVSSDVFIGNGSSCAALSQAMGHPTIIFVPGSNRRSVDFGRESTFIIDSGYGNLVNLHCFLDKYNILDGSALFDFKSNLMPFLSS